MKCLNRLIVFLLSTCLLVACAGEQPSSLSPLTSASTQDIINASPTPQLSRETPSSVLLSLTPTPKISYEQPIIYMQLQDETGAYCDEVEIYLDKLAVYHSCLDGNDTLYQLTGAEFDQLHAWKDLFVAFDGATTRKIAGEEFNFQISFIGVGRIPVSAQAREEIEMFALALFPAGKIAMNNALIPPTPAPIPNIGYHQQCIEVQRTFKPGLLSGGAVLFNGDFGAEWIDTYILTPDQDYPSLFSAYEQEIGEVVSPDRLHIAIEGVYRHIDGTKTEMGLHILTVDRTLIASMRWQDGWLGLQGWLNSTQVIISSVESLVSSENLNVYLVNPFTFEVLSVPAKNYDPQFTRYTEVRKTSKETALAIINIEPQEQISEYSGFTEIEQLRWSPDGNRVSFAGKRIGSSGFEIFVIDKNGALINLSKVYNFDTSEIVEAKGPFAWSPNGRYLAYRDYGSTTLGEFVGPIHTLIYDTEQQHITDYCNLSLPPAPEEWNSLLQASASHGEIVWSPDSTQLVMRGQLIDIKDRLILFDILRGFAVRIYDGSAFLKGWLVDP